MQADKQRHTYTQTDRECVVKCWLSSHISYKQTEADRGRSMQQRE